MIALEDLETLTAEKVGTKLPLNGRRVLSNMRPTRAGVLEDHFADLSSIVHGLSDVCELAPVGEISKRHPVPRKRITMATTGDTPRQRILRVFQDGVAHRADDVRSVLGEGANASSVGTELSSLARTGRLQRVGSGVYRAAAAGGAAPPTVKPSRTKRSAARPAPKPRKRVKAHAAPHEDGGCTACWLTTVAVRRVFPDVDLRGHLQHTPRDVPPN